MLLGKTKSKWNITFHLASELLVESPTKLELVQKTHVNPVYYTGCVTRKKGGNLSYNRSTPVEQNYLSIVSFNGDIILSSVCQHMKYLLENK